MTVLNYLKSVMQSNVNKTILVFALLFTFEYMKGFGLHEGHVTQSDIYTSSTIDILLSYLGSIVALVMTISIIRYQSEKTSIKTNILPFVGAIFHSSFNAILNMLLCIMIISLFLSEEWLLNVKSIDDVSEKIKVFSMIGLGLFVYIVYTTTSYVFAKCITNGQLRKMHKGLTKKTLVDYGYLRGHKIMLVALSRVFKPNVGHVLLLAFIAVKALSAYVATSNYEVMASLLSSIATLSAIYFFSYMHFHVQQETFQAE